MNQLDNMGAALARNTLQDIPETKADAKEITALVKDHGAVSGYQLSDGSIVSKADGVSLAKQGGIRGVGVAVRNGSEYLKSIPDGSDQNNLSNLPSVGTNG